MEFPSQPRSTNASLVPPPSPMHQHTHLPSLPSTDPLSMTTAEREGAKSGTTFSRDCAAIRDQIQLLLVLSRPRMRKQDGVRSNSIVSSHTPKRKTQESNLSSVAKRSVLIRLLYPSQARPPSCLLTSLSKLGSRSAHVHS